MTFEQLNLIPPLLRAVREKGYTEPTPIQVQAIPPALEGRDVLGSAQTGTGKTAAFALPILQRLWKAEHARGPRPILALVLCPTRELATQIGESFASYGKHSGLKSAVIFGGVGYDKQRSALSHGVDILVATPGRLLDLMGEKSVRFDRLRVLVLDEADRMLDLGFLPDVKRVLSALPKQRQTMCFSATMPPAIRSFVDGLLHDPARVAVAPVATTADKVEQAVYFVDKNRKADLLVELLSRPEVTRALVFTRTKRGANKVAERLEKSGVPAEAIHGNKSQNARERALASFKSARGRVLVATDIAARGLDVTGISHVINFELPNEPETYVHRIGRTARAAASGIAWSLCGGEERAYLKDIERLIRQRIPVAEGFSADVRPGARAPGRPVGRTAGSEAHGEGSYGERRAPARSGGARGHAPASHGARSAHTPKTGRAGFAHRPGQARPAAHRPAAAGHASGAHPVRSHDVRRPAPHERAPAHRPTSAPARPAARYAAGEAAHSFGSGLGAAADAPRAHPPRTANAGTPFGRRSPPHAHESPSAHRKRDEERSGRGDGARPRFHGPRPGGSQSGGPRSGPHGPRR